MNKEGNFKLLHFERSGSKCLADQSRCTVAITPKEEDMDDAKALTNACYEIATERFHKDRAYYGRACYVYYSKKYPCHRIHIHPCQLVVKKKEGTTVHANYKMREDEDLYSICELNVYDFAEVNFHVVYDKGELDRY